MPAIVGLKVTDSVAVPPAAIVVVGKETIKSELFEFTDDIFNGNPPVFSIVNVLVMLPVFISWLPKSVFLSTLIVVLPDAILIVFPFRFISLSVTRAETLKVYVPSLVSLLLTVIVEFLVPDVVGLNTIVSVAKFPAVIVVGDIDTV